MGERWQWHGSGRREPPPPRTNEAKTGHLPDSAKGGEHNSSAIPQASQTGAQIGGEYGAELAKPPPGWTFPGAEELAEARERPVVATVERAKDALYRPRGPSREVCQQRNPPELSQRIHTRQMVTPSEGAPLPVAAKSEGTIRRAVYRLRRGLAVATLASGEPLQRERIRGCGFCVAPAAGEVAIVKSAETGRCRYDGLITCGSVWECPACARAIKSKRAEEVKLAIQAHGNGRVVLLTLTVRHGWGDDLQRMRQQLADAWRGLTRGAPWRRFCDRVKLRGTVRAVEVTHGPNGFHPHLHVLLFIGDAPDGAQLLTCVECRKPAKDRGKCHGGDCGEWIPGWRGWMLDRWRAMVARYVDPWVQCRRCDAEYTQADCQRLTKMARATEDHEARCACGRMLDQGDEQHRGDDEHPERGRHMPSHEHALSLRPSHVSEYITKLGLEVSDPGNKRGRGDHRTAFQIAEDCLKRGNYSDRELWRTYCDAMRGARQLTWSLGLKAALGVRERTDLELAPDEEPAASDVVVGRLSRKQWHRVRVASVAGVPADFFLLVKLEQQGPSVLREALAEIETARQKAAARSSNR